MSLSRFPASPLTLNLGIGALGGVALFAVEATSSRGPEIYTPYTVLVLALAGDSWARRALPRTDRAVLFLAGFSLASLILYLGIVLVLNPSALGMSTGGHAWRLGFLVSIGAVLGTLAAALTGPGKHPATPS